MNHYYHYHSFQIFALHPDLPRGHPLQQRQQPARLQKPPQQETRPRRKLQVGGPTGFDKENTIILYVVC